MVLSESIRQSSLEIKATHPSLLRRVAYTFLPIRRRQLLQTVCVTIVVIYILSRSHLVTLPSVPWAQPFPVQSSADLCPITPPKTAFVPSNSSRFSWKSYKEKHPIQNYEALPDDRPPAIPPVQHHFEPLTKDLLAIRVQRQNAVKLAFVRCWNSYRKHAWMHDELSPVSGGYHDPFGGWGATLVDSLDTLWIMGMFDDFEEAVAASVDIDFNPNSKSGYDQISVFETTIRYLGGFLAAYDMTGCKDKRLLDKAVEVGDMLYAAFDTKSHLPVTHWSPSSAYSGNGQDASSSGCLAELGSFTLEFTRLSQLTGDMRYYDQAVRVSDLLEKDQNKTLLPGMWPVNINYANSDVTSGSQFSLGGMSDSAYEYLPKMYQLLSGNGRVAAAQGNMYQLAMRPSIEKLLFRPSLPDDADVRMPGVLTVPGHDSGMSSLDSRLEHLACFVGGMLALGGSLFHLPEHVETGAKVTKGCIWAYKHTPSGIMPEMSRFNACKSADDCSWNSTEHADTTSSHNAGYASVGDARYILRPEAIESVFYLYRITGDVAYQDAAWDMFQAVEKHTSTQLASGAVRDVMTDDTEVIDSMESFWLGETLKYYYLIFSDPGLISLDDFVFNTEAHPFRRPQ